MFLEALVNKTLKFYFQHNLAFFTKNYLPISVQKVFQKANQKNLWASSVIMGKSTVDYFGIWHGVFIALEAKSVSGDVLPLKNIAWHQLDILRRINAFGGLGFLLIYLDLPKKFFLVLPEKLSKIRRQSINLAFLETHGQEVQLIYPGILDLIICFQKSLIKKYPKGIFFKGLG